MLEILLRLLHYQTMTSQFRYSSPLTQGKMKLIVPGTAGWHRRRHFATIDNQGIGMRTACDKAALDTSRCCEL
jgi:hypothetical protein